METTHWTELHVTDCDGNHIGTLGEMVGEAADALASIELAADGSIDSWTQYFVAADGEQPGADSPAGTVDWTGFAEALAVAILDFPEGEIGDQIRALIVSGTTLDDIRVNDGNDVWGENCAVTRHQADAIRADWASDGQNISDLPELPTVREWLAAKTADAE